jgi:neutral ceramidase
MPTQLRAGVGRRDITPPLGSFLMGYANPDRKAESVRDGLNVTAIVVERDGLRVAILSLDACLPDEAVVAQVRAGIHERTGIEPANITVCYTQTHSGPNTLTAWGWCELDEAYRALMVPRTIDAAADANASLRPAKVGITTTQSDVGVNRRQVLEDGNIGLGVNPWAPYDPTMTVVRFETDAGPLASIIHYGAHPTIFNTSTRRVSRDWPGVMIDRVEHFSKAPAMFINGAVGDVAPRCNTLGAVGDGEASLLETGTRAGMDAMRAWRDVKEFRGDLALAVLVKPMDFPYRPLAPLDEAKRKVAEFAPRQNEYGGPRCEFLHWSAVIAEHAKTPRNAAVFQQSITQLGPIAIVPFPGEPFAETILRLRHASPFQHTLCASTTNASFGYFVTRDSLHRGGYEVWVAKAFGPYILAENIDDVLFTENLKMLRAIQGK